jgi:hypothetical protein
MGPADLDEYAATFAELFGDWLPGVLTTRDIGV